jgi:presenilin-like A22 family membrane protease
VSEDATSKSHATAAQTRQKPSGLPIGLRELNAVGAMLIMFIAAQLIAVLLAQPFAEAGVKGFENPNDWKNGVWLIGTILVFTAIILFIAKMRREHFIQWIILASVGLTLVYVFFPLLLRIRAFDRIQSLDARFGVAIAIAAVPAIVLTILLYKWPEWYIVDIVGILVAAGGIAIFGTSFTPVTYLLVLVGTAVYDYISVYKTKHMLSLADSVLNYHLPIMLVVPKHMDYSFLEESGQLRKEADLPRTPAASPTPAATTAPVRKPRDAMFLGLGDIVIPSIFAMTALQISGWASAGAMMGILAGFLFLMTFVLRGRPQAGLPSLNAGALIGFLIGLYSDKGTLVFW